MKLFSVIIFFFLLYLFPSDLYAQKTAKINGIIQDNKRTLPSATVLLYTLDSTLVNTVMTDQNGKFSFTAAADKYYIVSSSIGYNRVKTDDFQFNANADFQVPAITLKENSKNLREISITASKSVLERKADKLIFNVDASPSASGLNVFELLNKAPGVTIDHNENISLAGKANVLITIDGKQTYLSTQEVVNLLKSMQSNEIESLEIINNPGSGYDANSTGGIINIKTKKGTAEGFNGNVAFGAGFNQYLMTNNVFSLNYRKKYFNLFGSYSYNSIKQERKTLIDRITPGSGPLYFSQNNHDNPTINSQNFKIGTDFFLSSKHTIGFLVKGNTSKVDQNSYSRVNIGRSFEVADSVLKTPNTVIAERKNFSFNINYKGILDTAGQEINIDADYSTFDGYIVSNYVNTFYLPNGDFLKDGLIYRNMAPSDIDIKAIKVDYTLPVNKKLKLDAGLKIADVKIDNNYTYENNIKGEWIFDDNKSNRFLYDEKVIAGYTTLNITFGKIVIKGGLRAEHTNSKGNSITTSQLTKIKYTNLFPALLLTRNFNANNVLNLSYSRKINRPNYQNLNPFIFYQDQYTYNQGNPNLKPEYSNNLEAGYLFKQKYSVTLGYGHTSNIINAILLQNAETKSLYQTILNISSQDIFSLVFNFPVTITKWWNMNNNIGTYYYKVNAPELKEADLNTKQFSTNFYAQNNFILSKFFSADAALIFNTSSAESSFRRRANYRADGGLRYNFPNKMGNLKLGVSDIFHTQKTRLYSNLPGNNYSVEQSGTTTNVRITFTYRFGKMTVKPERNRSTGLDDEQKRL